MSHSSRREGILTKETQSTMQLWTFGKAGPVSQQESMVDSNTRLQQISRCLTGLSIGDSLGRLLFAIPELRYDHQVPERMWTYTDDTRMALAIAHNLACHGTIAQDELARRFAEDFIAQPDRGYGAVAHFVLHQIASGVHWKQASTLVYSGAGSKGNGGAMRAPVIGAYFFDDLSAVVQQSIKATAPTHAHFEGMAGAVAVAVAGALAVRVALKQCDPRPEELFRQVIDYTPPGQVRIGLQPAARPLVCLTKASE